MAQFVDYWRIVTPASRNAQYKNPTVNLDDGMNLNSAGYASFATVSWFSNLLKGATARLQRYKQYDAMDSGDISRALDIIAEEISAPDKRTNLPFIIEYQTEENQTVSDTTVTTIRAALRHWSKLQKVGKRAFDVARCVCKYGDCFFKKTSDTKVWEYVDPTRVIGIEVDLNGNKIAYHLRPSSFQNSVRGALTPGQVSRGAADNEEIVPASAMIHFTLSNEMGDTAPFGLSILQAAFKDFQKLTMLEDAAIIYRIVRAPERRVFYIDVGNMPPQRVKQYIEQIRNDLRQKRMPNTANANQADSQYNAECFALDTKIPLLDGRTLTLTEIIDEYKAGKKNWAYSCNPETGEFAPGPITWAGVTRRNADVVKLTLDTGGEIICTPDHKFPVRGKGFVEAKDILVNEDSLFPHNTRFEPINKGGNTYQQIWNNRTQEWNWTHRAISAFKDSHGLNNVFRYKFDGADESCSTVHHRDFNRYNNNPENLARMDNHDHWQYHVDNMEGLKRWREEGGDGYQAWKARNIKRVLAWSKDPEIIAGRVKHGQENPNVLDNQKKKFTQAIHDRLVELAGQNCWMQKRTLAACKNDQVIINLIQEANAEKEPDMLYKIKADTFDCGFSDRFCAAFGYAGWKEFASKNDPNHAAKKSYFKKIHVDEATVNKLLSLSQKTSTVAELQKTVFETFDGVETMTAAYKLIRSAMIAAQTSSWIEFKRKAANFNHKVVKIEPLGKMDTGTLTIDGQEKYHSYHTFAINASNEVSDLSNCLYTKNSIQEDYFMPSTAQGRGSRVETLPGGATWEIPELEYFFKKVLRAMRVPSSYMLGQDATPPGAQFNDGKVGVAYMEERIFANFITRIQQSVEDPFDEQFKTYLDVTGIRIDHDLFKLILAEPQNFALYRQAALDTDLIASYKAVEDSAYLSPRFMLERFLGLTKDEIAMNEALLKQERNIQAGLNVDVLQQLYDPNFKPEAVKIEGEQEAVGGEEPAETPETGEETEAPGS